MTAYHFATRPTIRGIDAVADYNEHKFRSHSYHPAGQLELKNTGYASRGTSGSGDAGQGWLRVDGLNSYIEFDVGPLSVGTWTLVMSAWGATYSGIVRATLGATAIGADIDFYKAAAPEAVVWGIRTIAGVADAAYQRLRFTIVGKNAASTGYMLSMGRWGFDWISNP